MENGEKIKATDVLGESGIDKRKINVGKHILTAKDGAKGGKNSKRKPFDQRFKDFLEKKYKGDTNEDRLRSALLEFALEGNVKAATELFDRAHGKAKQTIDQKTDIQGDININLQPIKSTKKKTSRLDRELSETEKDLGIVNRKKK